jgi:hypothetical protein
VNTSAVDDRKWNERGTPWASLFFNRARYRSCNRHPSLFTGHDQRPSTIEEQKIDSFEPAILKPFQK